SYAVPAGLAALEDSMHVAAGPETGHLVDPGGGHAVQFSGREFALGCLGEFRPESAELRGAPDPAREPGTLGPPVVQFVMPGRDVVAEGAGDAEQGEFAGAGRRTPQA